MFRIFALLLFVPAAFAQTPLKVIDLSFYENAAKRVAR